MPVRIHTAVMDKDLERAKEEKNKFLDFEFYVFSFFFPKRGSHLRLNLYKFNKIYQIL